MMASEVCRDEMKIGLNWLAEAVRRPETRTVIPNADHGSRLKPFQLPSEPSLGVNWGIVVSAAKRMSITDGPQSDTR